MSYDENFFRLNKPSIFVSYSRDSLAHIAWVNRFAACLKAETGCRLIFDQDLHFFEDLILEEGEVRLRFGELVDLADYVVPILTNDYLEALNGSRHSSELELHFHLIARIRERRGAGRIIPVFRQRCEETRSPKGVLDGTRGLVFPQEKDGFESFEHEFEELRYAVQPRYDPLPPAAFRREILDLRRITGREGSLAELYEALGHQLGDSIIFANGNLEYRLSWANRPRSIRVDAQQTYEVVNLTHEPFTRTASWDNAISDRFTLRSFECWAADNTTMISSHYLKNPLKRTSDGTRLVFQEAPVLIPPIDADGSGRIYCRARWSVDGLVVGKDTLNSLRHSAFNRRMAVVDAPDDICVTLTGRHTNYDAIKRTWLFEGLTLPGDTAELSWAPRISALYDLFISHASEDKESFVIPLVNALEEQGLRVWYDAFELKVGDSLRRSIDRGLADSRFGVVVLSSAFISKSWTQYELDGLLSKEIDGTKTILPIWHRITRDEVLRFSPTLADRVALNSSTKGIAEIAAELTEVALAVSGREADVAPF